MIHHKNQVFELSLKKLTIRHQDDRVTSIRGNHIYIRIPHHHISCLDLDLGIQLIHHMIHHQMKRIDGNLLTKFDRLDIYNEGFYKSMFLHIHNPQNRIDHKMNCRLSFDFHLTQMKFELIVQLIK